MGSSRKGEVAFCAHILSRTPSELCSSFRQDEEHDEFISLSTFIEATNSVVDGFWPPLRSAWVRHLDAIHRQAASLVRKEGNEFIHQHTLLERALELENSYGTSESRILLRAAFSCNLKLFSSFDMHYFPSIGRLLGLGDAEILPNIRRGLIDDHYELELFDIRRTRTFSHLHVYLPRQDRRPPQPPHSHKFDVGLWCLKGAFLHTLYKPILSQERTPYRLLKIVDSPESSRAVETHLWLNLSQRREEIIRAGRGKELRCGSFHSVTVEPCTEPTILMVKFEPVHKAIAFSCTFPGVEEAPKTKQFGDRFFTVLELENLVALINNSLLNT